MQSDGGLTPVDRYVPLRCTGCPKKLYPICVAAVEEL